jgi:hypothetical protein
MTGVFAKTPITYGHVPGCAMQSLGQVHTTHFDQSKASL